MPEKQPLTTTRLPLYPRMSLILISSPLALRPSLQLATEALASVFDDLDHLFRAAPSAAASRVFLAGGNGEAVGGDIAIVVERVEFGRDRPAARIADAALAVDTDFHRLSSRGGGIAARRGRAKVSLEHG